VGRAGGDTLNVQVANAAGVVRDLTSDAYVLGHGDRLLLGQTLRIYPPRVTPVTLPSSTKPRPYNP
jgi:hypothetical protein